MLEIILILTTIICLSLLFIIYILRKLILQIFHVNKNKNYLEIFHHFCYLAYDTIYKDQILAYSASGLQITGDPLETAKRNFIKLVIDLMGPTIYNYLCKYFGNSNTFNINLIIWFSAKIDNDEIINFTTKSNNDNQSPTQQLIQSMYDLKSTESK